MTGTLSYLDVSRETRKRLDIYAGLLRTWNPKVNLVAPSTMGDLWRRHFADSAQLYHLAPKAIDHWADLGAGGGFPGLVIAILAHDLTQDADTPLRVTLVESDARKSTFLRSVLRETGVAATVITDRIESVAPLGACVVSARALAPMTKLLGFASRHLSPSGTALLPKGQNWQNELREAQQTWQFGYRTDKSVVQENSVILSITGVSRV